MKQLSTNDLHPVGLSTAFDTHAGMTGKNNEDSLNILVFDAAEAGAPEANPLVIAIVADGVGGQSAGEFASQMAIEKIQAYFTELEGVTVETIRNHLREAIQAANRAVYEEAQSNPEHFHMATTIVTVALLDGLLFSSHVGDSRLYLMRESLFLQVTKDHSWIQEALEAGLITKEESRTHPNKNIIRRSLGSLPEVEIDQEMFYYPQSVFWPGMPLKPKDTLLLCSDGLNDMVRDYDIALSIKENEDTLPAGVQDLIQKANDGGGKDNISVVLIHVESDFKENENSPFPPPEPPVDEEDIKTTSFAEEGIDTVPNMPRVVSVPLDKLQRERDERRRRQTLVFIISLAAALIVIAFLIYFQVF